MPKSSNFEKYQEAEQTKRVKAISEYLDFLLSQKIKFRDRTSLSKFVAVHLSQVEERKCSNTTLLRKNSRYAGLLLSFMARQAGSLDALDMGEPEGDVGKALLAVATLNSSNLKRDNERLNIYIDELQLRLESSTKQISAESDSETARKLLDDVQRKLDLTCQALFLVAEHMKLQLEMDPARCEIRDLSRSRNNVVVKREVGQPFFEWYQVNTRAK